MEIIEAIRTRRSSREYKPDPVPKDILKDILDAARWSPSASNTQCWKFSVLGGDVLEKLKDRLTEKAATSEFDGTTFTTMNPDFPRSCPWPDSSEERRNGLRVSIDTSMFPPGTENVDEKRMAWLVRLLRFCEAPNVILVWTVDPCPSGMIDMGTVTQTICLAAHAHGIGTCAMQLPTFWPDIYRKDLGVPEEDRLAIAIVLGYPDMDNPVNNFERQREPLDALVQWYGV